MFILLMWTKVRRRSFYGLRQMAVKLSFQNNLLRLWLQNKHVQLLQHFSCHYQSGHDQPLEPVHVNCADYNEQMRMYMNIQYNFYTSAFIEYWGRA